MRVTTGVLVTVAVLLVYIHSGLGEAKSRPSSRSSPQTKSSRRRTSVTRRTVGTRRSSGTVLVVGSPAWIAVVVIISIVVLAIIAWVVYKAYRSSHPETAQYPPYTMNTQPEGPSGSNHQAATSGLGQHDSVPPPYLAAVEETPGICNPSEAPPPSYEDSNEENELSNEIHVPESADSTVTSVSSDEIKTYAPKSYKMNSSDTKTGASESSDISSNLTKTKAAELFDKSSSPNQTQAPTNTAETEAQQHHQQAGIMFGKTEATESPDYRVTDVKDLKSSNSPVSQEGPGEMYHSCDDIQHPNLSFHCANWLFNHYHVGRDGWEPCNSFALPGDPRCGLWWAKCKQSGKNKHCCSSVRCHLKSVYGVNVG
ncbi:hypothetical protein ACHWQZ_G000392 [Mnemiopsis leidyi]